MEKRTVNSLERSTKKGTREMIIKSEFWYILQKQIAARKKK